MGPSVSRFRKSPPTVESAKANAPSALSQPSPLAAASPHPRESFTSTPDASSPDVDVHLVTSISGADFTRQYHGVEDSEYFLPSDIGEQDRLELQHYLLRHVFKGDVIRKDIREFLETPGRKILDIGCANGWWLDSVGKVYLSAQLYGVDLAPNVVEAATKFLPHANFSVGNVLTGLPYPDDTFDFVHQRLLFLGLPKQQFHLAVRELIRVTKPGGWIELVEADAQPYRAGPLVETIVGAFHAVMAPKQLDFLAGTNLANYIKLAIQKSGQKGATRIARARHLERRTVSMPYNWGGPIGDMVGQNFKQAYNNMEDILHKQLGLERAEYRKLVEDAIEESKEFKMFGNTHCVSFQVEKSLSLEINKK
ncbi:hypothetical protein HK100_006329 [Physocladia obscura]|uniref:Methyltransferase domain-containing protein n=1 Tax=Physocladia obscura TaxID=109957 RepID=A0AAD5STA4_9FUNG|nr:hypothetical protein HK100_006329 [Physocladia obscura]